VFISLDRLAQLDAKRQAGTLRPNYEPVNNVLRRFKAIQLNARKRLAKRRSVKVEDVPWRIGCLHDLRDTFLTGIKDDVPIDVLQRIAGHADLATTIKFYTQATQRDAELVRSALTASGLAGMKGTSRAQTRAHAAQRSA
jgi:integrase